MEKLAEGKCDTHSVQPILGRDKKITYTAPRLIISPM